MERINEAVAVHSDNAKNAVTIQNLGYQFLEEMDIESKPFRELMVYYQCAIYEVKTKLDVLSTEFSAKDRSPIEFIKSRVKSPRSIFEKLKRKNLPLSVESIYENLNDIAGIRVICPFVEDIYSVADMLTKQDDINVLQVKDYIKNPKDNGYRSLHIILEIPVFLSDHKQIMKVEVQIRTIAMDFWASLEHEIHYKKVDHVTEDILEQLKECADGIYRTDIKMQNIKKRIQQINS